ncbi:NAD(P)/FAD-dependent oxidoreductase [Aestuariirhabdus litorea]|uniref:Pyridine nucleotide-disulfide oxidoreductase n=1 Tax=Aestuariirhabdus litorea TaxID=2528527 RepID=A0A3P3VME5_9GAMM|nr:FAD-dependent oxidoreductase [Aestuariirhabdus litorea]RRJ83800.1 pyridine nucleotide-disulfide oxidoreductase [Aestuariirhabdus litorea]RWW97023.1 pyridine nucleotide-disulfide oxidoreductase [Endozoicomonadaceae bacterium GTF-13]
MHSDHAIIIGASHAGAQLATALRQQGWGGAITLIGDEPSPPYQRPPLSKEYLAGKRDAEHLLIRPAELYAKHDIQLRTGCRVIAIDRAAREVELGSGERLGYSKLGLCTGARVRPIEVPGAGLEGVCYLRTRADVERIRQRVTPGGKAVIVGGGYIGLETAASLRQLGMQVWVLEMMGRVLARVTAPPVSDFYRRYHEQQGVNLELNCQVQAFEGGARVERVQCLDGRCFDADLVVVGIGVIPNQELASETGLEVANGVVVDACGQTSDPDIVALGDCCQQPNPYAAAPIRLESVPSAMEQARCAAATLCGHPTPNTSLPWFWSDQYDLKLQIAGLNSHYDQVVLRGDPDSASFVAWYLKQGKLLAADCINRPKEFMVAKQLIGRGGEVDAEQLADEQVAPKALLADPTQ